MNDKITLIIPDLHHKWQQAEIIISAVGADEIIFLGDYFDDFDDEPAQVSETCDWLEASVNKPNRIHLFGNHDQHYAFVYRSFQCSGYTQWKYFTIHDRMNSNVWDKLKWYHFLDNQWLISHGGLHKFNLPESITKFSNDRPKFIAEISGYLDAQIREGFRCGATNQSSWIFNAGHSRGGSQRVGGITWCDFEREFFPIKGINQIVGHTPQGLGFPKWCLLNNNGKVSYPPYDKFQPTLEMLNDTYLSINIDLDVQGNMHYATWNGKKLVVGNYRDL